jgi:hypothetical protein
LPNISGIFPGGYDSATPTGAFKLIESVGVDNPGDAGTGKQTKLNFDASLCSQIYGNSDTVQPPANRVNWCIQVYNTATELSTLEST